MNKKGWWIFGAKKTAPVTKEVELNRRRLLASARAEAVEHLDNVVKWVKQGKTNSKRNYKKMNDILFDKVTYEQLPHDVRDFVKGYVDNRDRFNEFTPEELGSYKVFIEISGGNYVGRDKWASKTHTSTTKGDMEMRSDFDMRFTKPTTHTYKTHHKVGTDWSFNKHFDLYIVPVININSKIVTYIALLYKFGSLKEHAEAVRLKELEKTIYGWVMNV